MKFDKPFLTIEQQVGNLCRAGMGGDPQFMAERLVAVSYHRLSGYWIPFRQPDGSFRPGTTFNAVWRLYVFDRQLRLQVMDAAERFEIALRTQVAYHHARVFGPFAYAIDRSSRPKMTRADFPEFYSNIMEELNRSKEPFIKQFYTDFGDAHDVPPIWEAAEVMSFGNVVRLYRTTANEVKKPIASFFGVPETVMESWLLTLNTVRNICAHHARLWNRELGTKPMIPRAADYPEWHNPAKVSPDRIFAVLTICQHCLKRIAPQSGWADRLRSLLDAYREIPRHEMGFPENWEECPVWSLRAGGEV